MGVITTGPKKNSGLKVKVGMKMLLTDYKKNRVKVRGRSHITSAAGGHSGLK